MSAPPLPETTEWAIARSASAPSVALLLRHAERAVHPAGLPPSGAPLLTEGIAMARALGERLGSRLGTVRASPILRCRQTAQALMEGAGQAGDVPVDRRLGDPGVFIADPEVAGGTWERLGYGAVMEALSRGEQLPGFQHPGRASEELFNWMAELARAAPGVNVLITHDSVVWPVACWLSGWSAAQRWPGWLEGIALWREAGHTLTARGEELIRR